MSRSSFELALFLNSQFFHCLSLWKSFILFCRAFFCILEFFKRFQKLKKRNFDSRSARRNFIEQHFLMGHYNNLPLEYFEIEIKIFCSKSSSHFFALEYLYVISVGSIENRGHFLQGIPDAVLIIFLIHRLNKPQKLKSRKKWLKGYFGSLSPFLPFLLTKIFSTFSCH